jgi:hypothetical protein
MNKYKLIKTYPGSPELGTIIEEDKYPSGSIYKVTPIVTHSFPANWIENNPEFWQEIVEKEYEILSYYAKNISGKGDHYVDPDYIWYETSKGSDKWSRKGHMTVPYRTYEITNHNNYGIHSVKRLSDGEVFTVGDKINQKEQNCKNSLIESFNFNNKGDILVWVHNNKPEFKVGLELSKITKSKQPLFTTEDGVEIFEGDEYCTVTEQFSIFDFKAGKKHIQSYPNSKLFSTRKKAEEYVLMNKPCLSINEIVTAQEKYFLLYYGLKEIVKSKL